MKIYYIIIGCFIAISIHAQNTLSLSQAIELGLENNYALKIMRNDEQIASINNTWGNTQALPSVDFSLSGTEDFNLNDDDNYKTQRLTPEVNLSWVLFDGFSARITKRNYEELETQSKGNTVVLVETTIEDIISAYNNCIVQKELMNAYEDQAHLSEDRYNLEVNKKDFGTSTSYRMLQAKTNWLEDKSNFLRQKVTYENTIRTLNFVMGADDNETWQLTTLIKTDMPAYKLSELTDKLMSNNQTLKNAYIKQRLLAQETALARSDYYPSLTFNAGASHTKNDIKYDETKSNNISQNYSDVALGLTLSYALYSGGKRKRSLEIAKIEETSAGIETDEMEHSLSNELLQLYSTYELQKELFSLAYEKEVTARLNQDLSQEKFKNGTIDSFDFRDVQISYMNAVSDRLDALYNLMETQIDLLVITGGIISEYETEN
jgi:outer membrane protein